MHAHCLRAIDDRKTFGVLDPPAEIDVLCIEEEPLVQAFDHLERGTADEEA